MHPTHRTTLPDTLTTAAVLAPTAVTPARDLDTTERESMVWVPGPNGDFVAVPRSLIPADYFTPPAPAAPAPGSFAAGVDHRAQILAAGGIGIGAAGWGAAQVLSAFAGLGTAGLCALALLMLAARTPRRAIGGTDGGGSRGGDHTEIHVHKGGRVRARNVNIR